MGGGETWPNIRLFSQSQQDWPIFWMAGVKNWKGIKMNDSSILSLRLERLGPPNDMEAVRIKPEISEVHLSKC